MPSCVRPMTVRTDDRPQLLTNCRRIIVEAFLVRPNAFHMTNYFCRRCNSVAVVTRRRHDGCAWSGDHFLWCNSSTFTNRRFYPATLNNKGCHVQQRAPPSSRRSYPAGTKSNLVGKKHVEPPLFFENYDGHSSCGSSGKTQNVAGKCRCRVETLIVRPIVVAVMWVMCAKIARKNTKPQRKPT